MHPMLALPNMPPLLFAHTLYLVRMGTEPCTADRSRHKNGGKRRRMQLFQLSLYFCLAAPPAAIREHGLYHNMAAFKEKELHC